MMVKFSDFADPASWAIITAQIKQYRENPGYHQPPTREEVAATLRLGRPPPPEVCEFIADLLEGKVKRTRGRKGNKYPEAQIRALQLGMQVKRRAKVFRRYRRMGGHFQGTPYEAALADINKRTGTPVGALRAGVKYLNRIERS